MSFEPARKKLTIASIDDDTKVTAQFNPKELQVDQTVPWSKVNAANQANQQNASKEKGLKLEFTGAEGRSLSVELLFDGYETDGAISIPEEASTTVQEVVGKLQWLASVINPSDPSEEKRRPHHCVVTWGDRGLPSFRCVIESVSTKYSMFSSDGAPLRATCTVKLKEADIVSAAKAKKGP